jgi:S-DNA-T family DNA segregation ATPase FtsK/SpoIIIE
MGDGVAEEAEDGPQIVVPDSNADEQEESSPKEDPDEDPSTAPTGPMELADEQTPSAPVEGDFGPEIVESEAQKESKEKQRELQNDDSGMLFKPKKKGEFELPPLSYLNYEADDVGIDPDALREMAVEIEQTLEDFNIDGSVVEICPGPVITMFEFKPAPGTKISKIANREDDLLMNLAAKSVRVVAPIPGKPVVGIEVSNPEREMVWLKEVIADESFQDNDMNLPLALGKGTAGEIETTDLSKMPHLLVAGATGSGKSVAVNSMICSLLYNFTPDELQMIMIDPKVLEFSVYNGIPHLHLPVVTDPKKATIALDWAVQEMEKRYERLADLGVRDIRGYNRRVKNLTEQARKDQRAGKEESAALSKLGVDAEGNPKHTPLPYLVVVIDEFADLMMTASKEVEQAVARLAQKARAAGVHMILATQRPSTDVITGMIKANFPARIALRVTSNTDSRVILGSNGAENLLGNGDMLIMPPGSSDLERVHGAFVSDEEIEKIVDFVSDQTEPDYDESILEEDEEEEESPLDREMEKDEYYEDAVRLVVQKDKASISMIQRKLRVGYNRAARMVEMMEQEGYVGPSDGNTAREVLLDSDPFAEEKSDEEDSEE